ncbi:hypothetical protein SDC9_169249 [bioreactor metagenome]|uniref:Uncharacterized protein n=1 Tax=bioreactor metagenome TaxID=1076179 RepID=A0A645G4N5_9ZZZZ
MHGERTLHAHPEAHLAGGEGLLETATGAGDHDAGEDLDAGTVALDDLDVDLDGVAGTEVRDVVMEGCGVDRSNQLAHGVVLAGATGHLAVRMDDDPHVTSDPPVAGVMNVRATAEHSATDR